MTAHVTITVTGTGDTPGVKVEEWTEQLGSDLRQVPKLAVRREEADGTVGMKSGVAQQIGVLALSGLLSASAIAAVIKGFLSRTTAGSITVQRGDRSVTVEGVSHKDAKRALADLEQLLGDGEAE